MLYRYRTLLLLAVLSFTSACKAQTHVESFNNYYLESIDKLRNLYAGRGIRMEETKLSDPLAEVKAMIESYGSHKHELGLVFYSVGNDSLRIWLLKKGELVSSVSDVSKQQLAEAEIRIRKAIKVDALLAARNAKNRGLTIKAAVDSTRPGIAASIRAATSMLLPPVIAGELTGLKHLIIVPEFNISQFPLYLLQPYGNDSYLVDSVSVSIAPHLVNLAAPLKEYAEIIGSPLVMKPGRPVVVGNPAFAHAAGLDLVPLPGAAEEADTVAVMLGVRAIKGGEATLANVLRKARGTDFLYLATHGFADLEKGIDGSFLAFTPDSLHPTGLWTARDIQHEAIGGDAAMAILSACQTGVGKVYDGGFAGLGRAFYRAGFDHTVMTLWSVDDIATMKLMTGFLKTLTSEELVFYPASHLRKAVLEFRRTDPDPAHWAPFMVFGFPY